MHLTPGAATVPQSFYTASGTITAAVGFTDLIHSTTWVNDTGAAVDVQMEFSVNASKSGAGVGGTVMTGGWTLAGGGTRTLASPIIQRVTPDYENWSASDQVSVPAGDTITVRLDGLRTGAAFNGLWEHAVMRVTAIKR